MVYKLNDLVESRKTDVAVYRFHYLPSTTAYGNPIRLRPTLCMLKEENIRDITVLTAYRVNKYGELSEKRIHLNNYDYFADTYEEAIEAYNGLVLDCIRNIEEIVEKLEKEKLEINL